MFDHEYTLVAHPRIRLRAAYRRAEDSEATDTPLTALSCCFDYRADGRWTEAGTTVGLPEHPEEAGVEWQGFHVALYRDDEEVVARDFSVVSELAEAVDTVDRFAPALADRGRKLVGKVTERRSKSTAESTPERTTATPIEMPQSDGTTVEALAPPAQATFEVYEAEAGEGWRWRLVHDNGNVIADSNQGYSSKRAAEQGIRSVKRNALGAAVEEREH